MTPLSPIERKWKRKGVDLWISVDRTNHIPTDITLLVLTVLKKKQGRGLGTAAMKDLCRYADQRRLRVFLRPTENLGSDMRRLRAFYRRFGFRAARLKGDMVRYPQRRIR